MILRQYDMKIERAGPKSVPKFTVEKDMIEEKVLQELDKHYRDCFWENMREFRFAQEAVRPKPFLMPDEDEKEEGKGESR